MTTPYIDELALTSKNNEGIAETFLLTTEVDGEDVPIDLTGCVFFAQARVAKLPTSDLICEITVAIDGDPTEGRILLTVTDEVMRDVDPVRGHYDVLVRRDGGIADNLYQAPFQVGGGVSDISQW